MKYEVDDLLFKLDENIDVLEDAIEQALNEIFTNEEREAMNKQFGVVAKIWWKNEV